MKDEWGTYWCIKCGEKARKKKLKSAARQSSPAGGVSSGGGTFDLGHVKSEVVRLKKQVIVIGLLLVVAVLRFSGVF